MTGVENLWSYLSATPLLWLTATVLAYLLSDRAARKLGYPPRANPVLMPAR